MAIGLACGFAFARYTQDDHALELAVMELQHEHTLSIAALRLSECRWVMERWRETAVIAADRCEVRK